MVLRSILAVVFSIGLILGIMGLSGCSSSNKKGPGSAKQVLTITWAQWVPSDVLKKMAKKWGEANGVEIKTAFHPWPQYGEKVFTEFAAKGTSYDIIIGDSQWIGKGVTEEHYLDLTDWMKAELDLSQFEPAALRAFCEYPQGSGKYYAAPCETDCTGFAYRKDLFEDSKEKEAFKAKYNRELTTPTTWKELLDLAEFFHRPDQKLSGISLFTDSGQYDAVTMGFQQVMWAFGAKYNDGNYKVEGVLNSPEGVEALAFYKKLLEFAPPGSSNYYHQESLQAYTSGSVTMSMNFYALFPVLADKEKNKYHDKTGFFAVPKGPKARAISLGGQGMSILKYTTPEKQALAKKFIKWFLQPEQQKEWASNPGCFTATKAVLNSPAFLKAAPFNKAFAESLPHLNDFYNIPEFAELLKPTQQHWNAAIVGKETPKAAMDAVAKEHTEILKKAGLLK